MDVIGKVQKSTDWVNAAIVVEKPNGKLRVCLDPRPLNQAIKRQHHRLPTAEEIISQMSGAKIFDFIHHLNQRHKVLLLLGGLQLPFDRESVTLITRFICSAVNKVFHLRKEKLREMEAPWLSK